MTLFVTGATGLVGTRLLPRLVAAGLDVRALVRAGRTLPEGVAPVHGDILEPDSLAGALEGVTDVLHMAAVLRTPDADTIRRVNVEGTRTLLDAVRAQAPGARFLLASTSLVYGQGRTRPAREDDPTTAEAPYPATKLLAEALVRESGLNSSVLRFGFVYGEGDGHLESLPGLAASWKTHPAQAHSLVHHRDIAGAVRLALTGAMDGRTVNLVDAAPVTTYEAAALVGAEVPSVRRAPGGPVERPHGRRPAALARPRGARADRARGGARGAALSRRGSSGTGPGGRGLRARRAQGQTIARSSPSAARRSVS
ncbi:MULTISPECIES: NAD-dependent epimerase/dehydratase family protein [unclassified Streptomyces]|uniref:NAD-dependent epimerase/dehydratase family protein n=1 Tax=unclassified Streptomyces TaxID=2593676 RepID=UPI001EF0720C|nr:MULTISPECIES: NAD(P)-dependent oxidoreductase [unclassified Streptomyces]